MVVRSSNLAPIICIPTGRPDSLSPTGATVAGKPDTMAIAVQARLSKYIADFYLSRRLLFIPYQNAQKWINGKTFLKIEKERLSKQTHKRIKQLAGFDLGQNCCEI
jgi:hypothetical protein